MGNHQENWYICFFVGETVSGLPDVRCECFVYVVEND